MKNVRLFPIVCILFVLNVITHKTLLANDISDLFTAICNGEIGDVTSLIGKNPMLVNMPYMAHGEQTALHMAASKNQLEIARFLIDQGAQIDAKDENSYKPMDLATSDAMKNLLLGKGKAPAILSFRNNFFQDIMGVTEEVFKALLNTFTDKIEYNPISNMYTLTINDKSFQMGNFYQISIEDLQTNIASKPFPGGGTFNVFYGKNLDVAAFQADPENDGAVFQVASNFNGLETVHQNQDITTQLITDYTGDPTQGPSASISAAPGLIFRRYFLFYNKDKSVAEWGQNKIGERQVNFLETITNQKKQNLPTMSKAGYVQFTNTLRMPNDDDFNQIKIGYHAQTAVTFGARSGNQHLVVSQPYPIIDQVFAAAADFGGTNGALKNNPIAQAWAQTILNAAYQGALHCTFVRNRKKVFLTLMGGGVFQNDFSWICNAITRMKNFIVKSGLEVTLIWRHPNQDKTIVGALKPLVKETGGHWTVCQGAKNDSSTDVISIHKNPLIGKLSTLKEKLNKLRFDLTTLTQKLAELKVKLT